MQMSKGIVAVKTESKTYESTAGYSISYPKDWQIVSMKIGAEANVPISGINIFPPDGLVDSKNPSFPNATISKNVNTQAFSLLIETGRAGQKPTKADFLKESQDFLDEEVAFSGLTNLRIESREEIDTSLLVKYSSMLNNEVYKGVLKTVLHHNTSTDVYQMYTLHYRSKMDAFDYSAAEMLTESLSLN